MLKVFVLDDDYADRGPIIEHFLNKVCQEDYKVEVALCVSEAKKIFEKGEKFDLIMLDRDIIGSEETGENLVEYIIQNNIECDMFIVHSGNIVGGPRMYDKLKKHFVKSIVKRIPIYEMSSY